MAQTIPNVPKIFEGFTKLCGFCGLEICRILKNQQKFASQFETSVPRVCFKTPGSGNGSL